MRPAILFLALILLAGAASAKCTPALDGMTITNDTAFCSTTYDVPNGIKIGADNIKIDCGTAVLRGNMMEGTAIIIEGRKNITITKCNILTFDIGILIQNSSFITIEDCALLKNRIGLRMINAYENKITRISDKSIQTPISMVMSKFNRLDINKQIDAEYCKDNICRAEKDMNPCVNDDFYCSPRCNEENDNDCRKIEIIKYTKPKENITEKEEILPEPQAETITITPKKKSRSWLLYPVIYILVFFLIQFYEHAKKD